MLRLRSHTPFDKDCTSRPLILYVLYLCSMKIIRTYYIMLKLSCNLQQTSVLLLFSTFTNMMIPQQMSSDAHFKVLAEAIHRPRFFFFYECFMFYLLFYEYRVFGHATNWNVQLFANQANTFCSVCNVTHVCLLTPTINP